jgi:hypothetical protein
MRAIQLTVLAAALGLAACVIPDKYSTQDANGDKPDAGPDAAVECGDRVCSPGETNASCAIDCSCGDDTCNGEDTPANCPGDCFCGNGACESGETVATCDDDCAVCGDDLCTGTENPSTCGKDCPGCGDGTCVVGETPANCPADCAGCGNGTCDAGEDPGSCSADCFTTPPNVDLVSTPSALTRETALRFEFFVQNANGATCTLSRGGPPLRDEPCVSPYVLVVDAPPAPLPDGAYQFVVSATNNMGSASDQFDFTLDRKPPDTSLAPSSTDLFQNSTTLSFTFTADEDATFTCALDGEPPVPCVSPVTRDGLGRGTHTFVVSATDPAGNVETTPAFFSWAVNDPNAPEVVFVAPTPAPGATTGPSVYFRYETNPTNGVFTQCKVDDVQLPGCPNGLGIQWQLPEGTHTVSVTATDGTGNSTTISREWNVACAPVPDDDGALAVLHLDAVYDADADPAPDFTRNSAPGEFDAVLGVGKDAGSSPGLVFTGRFDGALEFDGNDWMTWAPSSTPLRTDRWTLEAWVKPGVQVDPMPGIVRSASGDVTVSMIDEPSSGLVRFKVSSKLTSGSVATITSDAVPTDTWHRVVATSTTNEGALTLFLTVDSQFFTYTGTGTPASLALDELRWAAEFVGLLDEVTFRDSGQAPDVTRDRYCPLP